ncbi:diaminopimelate decarboxylase [Paenarthrobacter aurescens]|uniref:Diaminopimelate decarboxylase n=1 Tax=Paenarthrobacter aurescens TaxID=43663 RepID=A0A4Y3N9A1_PAEAU|nr:diaminopimelate decarboxylase [Paenarthrobacter aurescens]MDO6144037.1 diaminopimelate decarboxylase [Paenarthrobacter aurescens]MDO6147884.1 diaminopimelate decarboxylase [Paenarthrobacter aurescens]MDO6159128.1 diaminopimelate decarboxylase [Paenarthrobacter aurescens]MDO6163112.1 diaminopimelate decarboxylase [Paenarthrobacter aurescens]GEB18410.1 diaminopimelate decarboxylase [Paenarthrobacter aurescens]
MNTAADHASPLAPEWLSVPADLNALQEPMWAAGVGKNDAGEVTVDGMSVSELKKQFGTPLFVMSESDFRARARAFKDSFDAAFADICGGVDVYYAGKSFLCTAVASWVAEEGLRLDTCSGGELAVAARAGIDGSNLGLHGNNKSDAEINRALDMGLGRIVVDSLDELERVAKIASGRGEVAKVMLRLTPGVHAHTHEFIATAHEDQKFGLSMAEDSTDEAGLSAAEEAVAAATSYPSIELLGLHCHIGSQIFEPDGFAVAAEKLLGFLAAMQAKYSIVMPELDLGGGYGIAYTPVDTPRPPAEIAQAMAAVVRSTCAELNITPPRISIEPGRAIVGSTTFTLYEVGTLKTVRVDAPEGEEGLKNVTYPRRYVSVDGGMSDNARPVLYDADYSAILASRDSDADPQLSRVVGKHCESGDIVVRDVYLPADVAAGDLLAVPGTGAYCWALSSNYNYLARPGVVAVRDGAARLIVRGETEEDLLNRDMGVANV